MNNNRTLKLQEHLHDFDTLSLNDLDEVKLLNREDTKFVFNLAQLPKIIEKIKPFYRILEINKTSMFKYENTYFDTDNFLFYNQHHNEQRARYKVRFRKYSSNSKSFFEIKIKNNKNRTVKTRMEVDEMSAVLGSQEKKLVKEKIGVPPNGLASILNMQFYRITLSDNNFNERLTIDTNLSVLNGTNSNIFEQLVISEIKQSKYNPKSDFIKILRELKIPEMRFSKYCMGMLHSHVGIKNNRFKPKLLQIKKIINQN